MGSLWVGVDLPVSLVAGTYRGTLSLTARSGGVGSGNGMEGGGGDGGGGGGTYTVALSLVLEVGGAPIAERGDGDIYSLSRLRWLDSTAGIDDTLPAPFVPPRVRSATRGGRGGGGRTRAGGEGSTDGKGGEGGRGGAGFEVELLNKRLTIGKDGLLAQIDVDADAPHAADASAAAAAATAATAAAPYTLLTRPMSLLIRSAGAPLALALHVVRPLAIVAQNRSGVQWEATLHATLPLPPHAAILVQVSGGLEYDSFCEFSIEISSAGGVPIAVDDIQLELPLALQHARYMVGMGVEGVATRPLAWRWEMGTGNNGVWLGRVEAGTFLKLRGEGGKWEDPMFSSDNGVIPFIPNSWGGYNATPATNCTATGANVSLSADGAEVRLLAFSGPRQLSGTPQRFLFDVAATPSKPLNLSRHFEQRYLQVGYGGSYGTGYISPQQAAALNASVVTLHQGIQGVVNGTLVNPYINYPFVPPTVEFIENYTAQARALDMRVKFYYTIRELSSHAAELFPLKAIGGMRTNPNPNPDPDPTPNPDPDPDPDPDPNPNPNPNSNPGPNPNPDSNPNPNPNPNQAIGGMLTAGDPYTVPQPGYCQGWDCHGGAAWLHQHLATDYDFCWQQVRVTVTVRVRAYSLARPPMLTVALPLTLTRPWEMASGTVPCATWAPAAGSTTTCMGCYGRPASRLTSTASTTMGSTSTDARCNGFARCSTPVRANAARR